jgi:carotenoid 1,2-hydratase
VADLKRAPQLRLEVALDDPGVRWSGTGYHDANHGDAPLERDFRAWSWSRSEGPSGATLLYDVSPRRGPRAVVARRFDRRGGVEELGAPPVASLGTSRWGIPRETRCDARRSPELIRPLEDTPFYARSLVRTSIAGERVVGVHEQLSLDRFDTRWVQFLLPFKMRRA